jgi:hypothetical protein
MFNNRSYARLSQVRPLNCSRPDAVGGSTIALGRFFFSYLAFLIFLLLLAAPAQGQFIGYTSPQTVSQTFSSTCTGSPQFFNVNNLGQTTHYVIFQGSIQVSSSAIFLQGSSDGVTFRIFSDTSNGIVAAVGATGYYPVVQIQVTCTNTATFTLLYSGTSASPTTFQGLNLQGQINKQLFQGAPAGSSASINGQRTPFGNSSGTLNFIYTGGAGPGGSTLSATCSDRASVTNQTFGPFALATTASLSQVFQIPAGTCENFTVNYNAGGASANSFNLDYDFNSQGFVPNVGTGTYTHVTGTTATSAKGTPGFLHTLTVNTGGAGTISIFDLATAACTGTPATNTVAVITAVAGTLQTFTYDVNTVNGICVKASVAMDFTVSSN